MTFIETVLAVVTGLYMYNSGLALWRHWRRLIAERVAGQQAQKRREQSQYMRKHQNEP